MSVYRPLDLEKWANFVTVPHSQLGQTTMDLNTLNQRISRYNVAFDASGIVVAGQHYAYTDIQTVHYLKPKKRAGIRLLITAATVALAAWAVLASQYQSPSIKLAVGLLIALTVARFYLLGKVFPKLSLTLKNGDRVAVMRRFDLIAADSMYEQLMRQRD